MGSTWEVWVVGLDKWAVAERKRVCKAELKDWEDWSVREAGTSVLRGFTTQRWSILLHWHLLSLLQTAEAHLRSSSASLPIPAHCARHPLTPRTTKMSDWVTGRLSDFEVRITERKHQEQQDKDKETVQCYHSSSHTDSLCNRRQKNDQIQLVLCQV